MLGDSQEVEKKKEIKIQAAEISVLQIKLKKIRRGYYASQLCLCYDTLAW